MGKSTSVKREIRFQQWIQQVKEYKSIIIQMFLNQQEELCPFFHRLEEQ